MNRYLISAAGLMLAMSFACNGGKQTQNDYPITPISFAKVHLTDNFWAQRIRINHEVS